MTYSEREREYTFAEKYRANYKCLLLSSGVQDKVDKVVNACVYKIVNGTL